MDKENGFQIGDCIIIVKLCQIPKGSMQINRVLYRGAGGIKEKKQQYLMS